MKLLQLLQQASVVSSTCNDRHMAGTHYRCSTAAQLPLAPGKLQGTNASYTMLLLKPAPTACTQLGSAEPPS